MEVIATSKRISRLLSTSIGTELRIPSAAPARISNSPGGMGCPPNGPQPSNGVTFTGTTSAAHYSITAVPGATALSATVSYPQCQYYMTGVADQNPHDNPSMTLYTLFGCSGGTFFYTTDGSQATEASQMCGTSGCMFSAPSAAPLSILAALLQSNGEGSVQNAQATPNTNFKTVLASTNAQDGAYWSFYHTPTRQDCTDAEKGTGNDNQYCSQGVQGIPTAINFATSSFPSLHLQGGSTSANLNFATENLQGTWNGSGESSASSPNGTQVLWPIKPSNACHGCTSMVQDFYIWPQHTANVNAAEVQNWELDLEHYDASSLSGTRSSTPMRHKRHVEWQIYRMGVQRPKWQWPGWHQVVTSEARRQQQSAQS